jgi:AcrR family transcriptional regulator
MHEPGLREIKKEATAHALAQSAFELALERGLDGFVIDDVARRAGYSRRTFANYFSCKEEAVVSVLHVGDSNVPVFIADFAEDASLLDVLEALIRRQMSAGMLETVHRLVELCQESPALEPYILAAVRQIRQTTVAALVEFAQGRYSDRYIHMLFAMAYGSLSLLFDGDLDVLPPGQNDGGGQDAVTFEEFIDSTFAYLRNGF